MKTWIKILMWSIFTGGVSGFGMYQLGKKIGAKEQAEYDVDNVEQLMKELTKGAVEEAAEAREEKKDAEEVRKEYAGEPTETATDEDPPMVEDKPEIGDEDQIEASPAIEFITEEEYYENSSRYAQEELIWYSLDEVMWNKDTKSKLNTEEIRKSIGYGTTDIFDKPDAPSFIFVKNHILMCMFRVDFMDAAFIDEHGDIPEEYEEDDD